MSTQRQCDYWKATDGKWYLRLGRFEHAYERADCDHYGPFNSFDDAYTFCRDGFSNPGGYWQDDSGESPPPDKPIKPTKPNKGPFFFKPKHRFC